MFFFFNLMSCVTTKTWPSPSEMSLISIYLILMCRLFINFMAEMRGISSIFSSVWTLIHQCKMGLKTHQCEVLTFWKTMINTPTVWPLPSTLARLAREIKRTLMIALMKNGYPWYRLSAAMRYELHPRQITLQRKELLMNIQWAMYNFSKSSKYNSVPPSSVRSSMAASGPIPSRFLAANVTM